MSVVCLHKIDVRAWCVHHVDVAPTCIQSLWVGGNLRCCGIVMFVVIDFTRGISLVMRYSSVCFVVIDITRGIQTQTAECIVIGEILSEHMVSTHTHIHTLSFGFEFHTKYNCT